MALAVRYPFRRAIDFAGSLRIDRGRRNALPILEDQIFDFDVAITGTASITLEDATVVAVGIGLSPITGTAAVTLDDATVVSTATASIRGTAAVTLDDATVSGAAKLGIEGWAGSKDPHFASNSLLVSFDGTDGATSATDDSFNAHALTFHGNAQIDTAQSRFGGASLLLDGTGDGILIDNSPVFQFGSGPFTIEC